VIYPPRLFLYGTLLDPSELARRGGVVGLGRRSGPCRLVGWTRVSLRATRWPTLRRQRGGETLGLMLPIPVVALRRLAAYEGPAYRLTRVVVTTLTGKTAAWTWIAPGGTSRPWKG
jgi:hypothetical protein